MVARNGGETIEEVLEPEGLRFVTQYTIIAKTFSLELLCKLY